MEKSLCVLHICRREPFWSLEVLKTMDGAVVNKLFEEGGFL